MGHLKMLVNEHCQNIPLLGILHGFDVFLYPSKGVFFVFINNNFYLLCLCLRFSASSFIGQPLSTVLFDMPRLLTIEAYLLLPVLFQSFSCINVHAIFRADVIASLLIDQLHEIGFLFVGVFSVPQH
jgi:hypothetical protein